MKIIVAGTRTFSDRKRIYDIIDNSKFDITEIVSGGSVGVDRVGERWAIDNNLSMRSVAGECKEYGIKIAPLKRNEMMAEYADGLIAIWVDKSFGTGHMIDCMKKLGKPIEIVEIEK
jgi:hypothetical protein